MELTVLSLNVWEGGILMNTILPFFKRINADVLLLQEVCSNSHGPIPRVQTLDILLSTFPEYAFHYFTPELHYTKHGISSDSGNAILSKFPILHSETMFLQGEYQDIGDITDRVDFSETPKNMVYAELGIHGTTMNAYSLHGIWGLRNGYDNPARLEMSRKVIEHIKNRPNVLLAGDFNTDPDTRAIGAIEAYLTNVFKGKLTSTFNMKHKTDEGFKKAVVDMMFVSPNIEVVKFSVPDDDVSDHLPLLCNIRI